MENVLTKKTAILVDGGYYRVRSRDLWQNRTPSERADELYKYCIMHITKPTEPRDLYRIFYYDCPPMTKKIVHPLTGQTIDYSVLPQTKWAAEFLKRIVEKRKVALRLGELADSTAQFVLKESVLNDIISGAKTAASLTQNDFRMDVKQKGVDMRIGLDVASLAYNRIVDQIVLIAGDSDFLPVVKMARRSGIDVLLDPMKQFPKRNMQEHVDGIESFTDLMYPTTASVPTV